MTRRRTPGARDRLLDATTALMRERGVHGAGVAELLQRSGAARGSVYQHFPGGKSDLVAEATLRAGRFIEDRALASDIGTCARIDTLLDLWERMLVRDDFSGGCPVVAAALAGPDEACAGAAAQVFATWTERLAEALADDGLPGESARSLAGFVVSAIEGAIIQSLSLRSTDPLTAVRRHLHELLTLHGVPAGEGQEARR